MGEQMRAEDWLPEGWKIEIRVRKSGKKDRYYTDPVNGYIFRSLKDIDRYLLSGKLGKHVTKNKPKDSEDANFDFIQHTDVPKKKKSIESNNGDKKKRARNESKGGKSGAENPKETTEKTISKPLRGGRSSRTKKKRESTPFFILDPDQCEDSSAVNIPNISEIIDSMLKEKENPKTVYLSAPAIGSLLGEKLSETRTNNCNKKPKFAVKNCKDNVTSSNKLRCTGISTEIKVKKEDLESKSILRPYQEQEPSALDQKWCDRMITDGKAKECPESPLFADLFEDPCIDFAIKTLTGTSAFGV